ncbi:MULTISPECIES: hypothetical protein [Pyrobaculum]|uniref:Uncharacterized protein n=3 Tax=Pyrobaculum TaxID=2276 RepID=A4WIK6_PYRAR|nr:hypothetical protein [Pyrobaculum arsenaticum]ABP50223.1 conserved hypothetical protein [Pyrobaculum arsenaticum DSM 13514]AFA39747.1 hypothetical protein Pogu_1720 [Pyrobaculum oguniense TE7]MCY0889882.1 hypothetical protein [Pyrobaculum arsenaticum]NYR14840.1 hypothetical protein [Pyrobaculum arsenaticum]
MDRVRSEELLHLVELMKLKNVAKSEYLAEFIDGIIRETYLRLRLLDVLSTPEITLNVEEQKPLDEIIRTLEDMCKHYEAHLAELRKLRVAAKTPLELELVAAMEKSLERSHVAIRMLINALTETTARG